MYGTTKDNLPDTDALVLVGQVDSVAIVVVKWSHVAGRGLEEVLYATLRGQVVVVARVLCNLWANASISHWKLSKWYWHVLQALYSTDVNYSCLDVAKNTMDSNTHKSALKK